jgi:hypothetical protein
MRAALALIRQKATLTWKSTAKCMATPRSIPLLKR